MRDRETSLCECSGFQKTSKGRGVHNCIKGVFKPSQSIEARSD